MAEPLSTQVLWGSLAGLIALSGIFSGSETALMAVNRYRMQALARKGNQRARRVQALLTRPDRLLGVILIGNTCTNVLASSIMTMIAVRSFGQWGLSVAITSLTLVILIVAEVMPKTLAVVHSQRISMLMARPLRGLLTLFYPLVWLVNGVANTFLRFVGVRVKHHGVDPLSGEEIKGLLSVDHTRLSHKHRDMVIGLLDLENLTVNDVMIPRTDIQGLDLSRAWPEVLMQLKALAADDVLVFSEHIERVHGVLSVRRVIDLLLDGCLTKHMVIQACRPVVYVPAKVSLTKQLQQFQRSEQRLGLVVDEYGDIEGMISFEDILDEILGSDAFSDHAILGGVTHHLDGSVTVPGTINIRDLNRLLTWELPVDGPNTLSGLLVEELTTIPEHPVGIRVGGYPIEILSVKDNLIERVKVYPRARHLEETEVTD